MYPTVILSNTATIRSEVNSTEIDSFLLKIEQRDTRDYAPLQPTYKEPNSNNFKKLNWIYLRLLSLPSMYSYATNAVYYPCIYSYSTRMYSYVTRMYSYTLVCYSYVSRIVCIRMLLECTRMHSYVTRMLLACIRMPYSNVHVCNRMLLACYSLVTRMLVVCTRVVF